MTGARSAQTSSFRVQPPRLMHAPVHLKAVVDAPPTSQDVINTISGRACAVLLHSPVQQPALHVQAYATASWLLVMLIGRSLGLIYRGVRQSLDPNRCCPWEMHRQLIQVQNWFSIGQGRCCPCQVHRHLISVQDWFRCCWDVSGGRNGVLCHGHRAAAEQHGWRPVLVCLSTSVIGCLEQL